MCILPENSPLFGPPSSTAGSPVKTTSSDDLGSILVSMAALKSCQINIRLTIRRFVSHDSNCPDNSDILPCKAALCCWPFNSCTVVVFSTSLHHFNNFEFHLAVPYDRVTTWNIDRHALQYLRGG